MTLSFLRPESSLVNFITWTKLLDSDPMINLNNWTNRVGTWTPGGEFGVVQNAGYENTFLECNVDFSGYSYRAIEATVRLTYDGKLGLAFCNSGSWNDGDFSVCLDAQNNDIWYDRYGSVGGSIDFEVPKNVDRKLKLVERLNGLQLSVYVDDILRWNINHWGFNTGKVGLYLRWGNGWYRDITVWGGKVDSRIIQNNIPV